MVNKIIVGLALVFVAIATLIATALLGMASGAARGARALLGDRLTSEGNRLYRLTQRLEDAMVRIDAAVTICVKG